MRRGVVWSMRVTLLRTLEKAKHWVSVFRPKPTFPVATRTHYVALHQQGRKNVSPVILKRADQKGVDIPLDWIHNLALVTQTVVKESALNWNHGPLLYAELSALSGRFRSNEELVVLETGTARGFSATICARALIDAGQGGFVFSWDTISPAQSRLWNSLTDLSGKVTRRQLLDEYQKELSRILFLQGVTPESLESIDIPRVHFAFLDATHDEKSVLGEYSWIRARQQEGDIIVFDDVSGAFPGVQSALAKIESDGLYCVEYIDLEKSRGYAVAYRAV